MQYVSYLNQHRIKIIYTLLLFIATPEDLLFCYIRRDLWPAGENIHDKFTEFPPTSRNPPVQRTSAKCFRFQYNQAEVKAVNKC